MVLSRDKDRQVWTISAVPKNTHLHFTGAEGEIRVRLSSDGVEARLCLGGSLCPLRGLPHHFLSSPHLITNHSQGANRKEEEEKNPQRAKVRKVNGGNSMRSAWISPVTARQRLRREKGAQIGVVSVCRLLKWCWDFLLLPAWLFKMRFSLFFLVPSRLFFSVLPWQQPYVRDQTQGRRTALPLAVLLTLSKISHCKNDFSFPPRGHNYSVQLYCLVSICKQHPFFTLPTWHCGAENASFIWAIELRGRDWGCGRLERSKINVPKMKVNQYGCPRKWKGGMRMRAGEGGGCWNSVRARLMVV